MICFPCCVIDLVLILVVFHAHDNNSTNVASSSTNTQRTQNTNNVKRTKQLTNLKKKNSCFFLITILLNVTSNRAFTF